jgi:Luciferase-like monooxygenase
MLDESLEILVAAWSGEPVHHQGEHYSVDGLRFLPRPVRRPGVPVWVAGFYGKPGPLCRAARHEEFFPVNLEHPDQLAEKASPTSPRCAGTRVGPPAGHTTSLPPCRPAAIQRPTPQRGLPGSWWSSPGRRYRWIRCVGCSSTVPRRRRNPARTVTPWTSAIPAPQDPREDHLDAGVLLEPTHENPPLT